MILEPYADLDGIVAHKPKFVTSWARRDVVTSWLGRLVSVKWKFSKIADPNKVGVITEVGRVGWVGVLWEDGAENADWNRRELDDYQGPHNWECRQILIRAHDVHKDLLEVMGSLNRSELRRNGDRVPYHL